MVSAVDGNEGDGRRLRVALLLDGDPRVPGATRTKFGRFVDVLAERVELIGPADLTLRGPLRAISGVTSWHPNRRVWKEHYRKNPLTFLLRGRQSRRWLRPLEPGPDIVLQVGAMSHPRVASGAPFALYLDFTFALTRREWPERAPMWAFERPWYRRLERATYEAAGLIFCRSEHLARSLRDDYGIATSKIRVVGAGVNLPLPPLEPEAQRDRQRVLFIGSDYRRKGGDVVLRAWPAVRASLPEATVTMVGPVPDPLPPGVEVAAGRWDPARVETLLGEANVFTMPSRCETWGDVFLEAMAYGLPCIGTTNDAMPEIIVDGVTGFVVPPDDPAALARGVVSLLQDPDLATAMGIAGRRRVEERYRWESVIDAMLPDLAALAATQRGRRSR